MQVSCAIVGALILERFRTFVGCLRMGFAQEVKVILLEDSLRLESSVLVEITFNRLPANSIRPSKMP